jgi:photosystem II stability/assembly factor-like uncharacterized protein
MGRVTLVLALFLPGLAIAAAQNAVPFVNQPLVRDAAAPGGPPPTPVVNDRGVPPAVKLSTGSLPFNSKDVGTTSPAWTSVGARRRSRAIADASDPSSGQWTLIGPQPLLYNNATFGVYGAQHSGQTNAVAVDPRNSSVVYLGAEGGGVWKTTDGGQTWTPLTDSQPSLEIGALALDPSNPDVVYAGTSLSNGSFASEGKGILKSTDGGATWRQLPGPLPSGPGLVAVVYSLAVSPSDGNVLLAVADSVAGAGLYRSADGGNTWSSVVGPITNSYGLQVLFDPTNGSIAFASLDTVYKSTDGGNTWTAASGTGSNALSASQGYFLAIDPSSAETLYAGIGGSTTSYPYLFKTVDGGQDWTPLPSFGWWATRVGVDPANPNIVVAGNEGLVESMDGGSTWNSANIPLMGTQAQMGFSPDGSLLYLAAELGVWSATNIATGSWTITDLNATLATQELFGITIHPTNPAIAFAGSASNGIALYSGQLQWESVICDNGEDGAFDFMNPSTIYAVCGSYFGGSLQKSTDGGATFAQMTSGIDASELAYLPAMAMDPVNPQRLYLASTHVWQTNDGANTWTAISPALGTAIWDQTLAVSPNDPNTVYLGNSNGVYVTTNALAGAAATWTAAGAGLPPNAAQCNYYGPTCSYLNRLVADPSSSSTAYAVFAGYTSGHVYKTTNRGSTWADISGNLPNLKVNDIAVDPDVPRTLYVGTEQGVYVTSDGGNTWNPLGTGLPNVAVTALKLHRPTRLLRAATLGRSAWDLQLAAVPSPVALSTTSLTFGNQAPAQTVTLTNSGTAPLTLYSVTAPNGFSQGNTCGVQIAAGASCTLTVNFVAATPGSYSGNITLSDDAPGEPQLIAVTGTGTGAAPGAALSPMGLTFSSQLVNTASAAQTVTLANNGSATLAITTVAASANFAQTNTCGGSVAVGANCAISVTFTPTAGGPLTGTITVTDNAPAGSQTVALSGTGEDFSLSATSSAATVAPGQTASYTLNLTPAGGFNQSVSLSCTGAPAKAMCSISPASVTLNGSSSQDVTVTVTTTAASALPPDGEHSSPLQQGPGRWPTALWILMLALALAVGAGLRPSPAFRRADPWVGRGPGRAPALRRGALAAILLFVALWASCGGGGGSSGGGGNPGTPAGTYNLTVSGTYTSGSTTLTHDVTLTLTVE